MPRGRPRKTLGERYFADLPTDLSEAELAQYLLELAAKIPDKDVPALMALLDAQAAEQRLAEFVAQAWAVLEPGTPYRRNWHHDYMDECLEAVTDGEIRRLIINVPPRSLKSTHATICWPAWTWIRQPQTRFLFASYSAPLSLDHSVKRRMLLESPYYQLRWRDRWAMLADQNRKEEYTNTQTGTMFSTSVGGSSTGKGGEILVLDDPMNPMESASDTERMTANEWVRTSFLTRLNDPKTGRIVVIMQRLHEEDTTGMLLDMGGWTHICLPTEAEGRTVITYPKSGTVHVREDGELLHPERMGPTEVQEAKRALGAYGYSGQHQQRPSPLLGGVFKRTFWRFWYPADKSEPSPVKLRLENGDSHVCPQVPLPEGMQALFTSWDCAFKALRQNDYVCGQLWGARKANFYLLDQVLDHLDMVKTQDAIGKMARQTPQAVAHLIEDKANGPAILAQLRNTISGMLPVTPEGGKLARAQAVAPMCEAGNVYLPHPAYCAWSDAMVDTLAGFPAVRHDDAVDALTQALNWGRGRWTDWDALFAPTPRSDAEREQDAYEQVLAQCGLTGGGLWGWT